MKNIEEVYHQWLRGTSLRKLARKYGYSQTYVHYSIRSSYGAKACNVTQQSTARSMLQDYPDYPDVAMQLLDLPDSSRSKHTEDMYTRHQAVMEDSYLYSIPSDESTQDTWLNFYGFTKLVNHIVDILGGIIYAQEEKDSTDT